MALSPGLLDLLLASRSSRGLLPRSHSPSTGFVSFGRIWQPVTSLAIGFDGAVYFGWAGAEYEFVCLGPGGGTRWRIALSHQHFESNPVIGKDGTVYVGVRGSGMNAIDEKGVLRWVYPSPQPEKAFTSAVVGENGLIYFGDSSNTLYALKPDGSLAWSRGSIGGAGPPALAPDGTLYAVAGSVLFAVSTSSKGMARSAWPCENHDLRNTRSSELPFAQRAIGVSKIEGGRVTAVTVYEPGNGYQAGLVLPVIFVGNGQGASAHAVVEDGKIVAIEMDEPGYGYTLPPQVTIGSPPFVPEIRIQVETVRVEMRLILGELYQLETSMEGIRPDSMPLPTLQSNEDSASSP
jgi:PQQ-like domain